VAAVSTAGFCEAQPIANPKTSAVAIATTKEVRRTIGDELVIALLILIFNNATGVQYDN